MEYVEISSPRILTLGDGVKEGARVQISQDTYGSLEVRLAVRSGLPLVPPYLP